MKNKKQKKIIIICFILIISISSFEFFQHQKQYDNFVAATQLVDIKYLSNYEPTLEGSIMDAPVYIFDSKIKGGTVFIMAGTHPNECGSILAAYVLMENLNIQKGKVIVLPVGNLSAQTSSCLGNAYPTNYNIKTSWGEKQYKIGDRNTNPLDQWPDPLLFFQFPSSQHLSFQESRNINRNYPGKSKGSLTERTSLAITNLLKTENVDLAFDCHEASLTYPVNQTIVSSEICEDIAFLSSIILQDKGINMRVEVSQDSLHGYSHSQWPATGVKSFLIEVPNPFQDRITGPITELLLKEGKDEFLLKLFNKGLINADYSNEGSPLESRVGLTLEAINQIIICSNEMFPASEVIVTWPTYNDLTNNKIGSFIHDPSLLQNSNKVYSVKPKSF